LVQQLYCTILTRLYRHFPRKIEARVAIERTMEHAGGDGDSREEMLLNVVVVSAARFASSELHAEFEILAGYVA